MIDAACQSDSKKPSQGRRLPLWARLIVGTVLTAICALAFATFRLADLIELIAKDSIDPKKMPAVAREIADFPEPLPAGYKYEYAYDFLEPSLQIRHYPDNQLMQILCYRNVFEDDPQLFLNRAIDLGDKAVAMPNKIRAVQSKGKETVCGSQMPYIVGEFSDERKRNVEGMIACICIKEKRKTILIYALEPPGTPYNLQVTMDLLKSIKSF